MGSVPTIAIDAMGGDHAPGEIVSGAVEASRQGKGQFRVILVGQEDVVRASLEQFDARDEIEIRHAPSTVTMADSVSALRRKMDSSLAVAIKMQKTGEADAVVSAGNTGAAMALSLLILGRIPGVSRPAIACPLPSKKGVCTLLDVGANSSCEPENLYQFAVMGSLYHSFAHGIKNPSVGLLSIGEESSKGDELVQKTHVLLAASSLNFFGNVEGSDILPGAADVVVCDGFTGNVVLKFAESAVQFISGVLKDAIKSTPISMLGGLLIQRQFNRQKTRLNYEEYGGAPLLGIDGVTIICHGRSSGRAILNATRVAAAAVRQQLTEHIKAQLLEKATTDATA
jgi:glycerol-3-phosphate acyltransferase PlsX